MTYKLTKCFFNLLLIFFNNLVKPLIIFDILKNMKTLGSLSLQDKLFVGFSWLAKVLSYGWVVGYGYDFIHERLTPLFGEKDSIIWNFFKIQTEIILYNAVVIIGMILIFPTLTGETLKFKVDLSDDEEQSSLSKATAKTQTGADILLLNNRYNNSKCTEMDTKNNRLYSSTAGLHFHLSRFSTKLIPKPIDKYRVDLNSIPTRFKDLGGLIELKELLQEWIIKPFTDSNEEVPITNKDMNGNSGASTSSFFSIDELLKGILLIGKRGTGKSSIVHAVFNEILARKCTSQHEMGKFYRIEAASCIGPLIGPGITFKDLFLAAQKDTVLSLILIENIEQLNQRAAASFLSELDKVLKKEKLIVFATTSNKTEFMERLGLITEGKLDHIYVKLPDTKERVQILKIHLEKRGHLVESELIEELAEKTESFSGKELEKIVCLVHATATEKYNALYYETMMDCSNVKEKPSNLEILGRNKEQITKQDLLEAYNSFCKSRLRNNSSNP